MPVPADRGVHRRTLLRDDVYFSLRDAIVSGRLAPGEKLRDAELSEWLGVSRTPIREALLRLERSGLVIAEPGRLTMVSPVTDAAVAHAQQIAAELHALAVRLAVPLMTEHHTAAMAEANAALDTALTSGDAEAAVRADDAFHAVAVELCGNPLVAEHLEPVTAMLRRAEYLRFGDVRAIDSAADHAAIVDACATGDADRAAELTRSNWSTLANRGAGAAADQPA
ncbi:GntR family transcriptional regulator [Brevibacterium ihuae]|uniref:GntR family transcriptional regulator n=1 Tax=Brevibacterium ihuae TaxID=1631743 RepID=UPI000C782BBD|nr:GntR family transcriptional regulator [Brevibacterium ihuae]